MCCHEIFYDVTEAHWCCECFAARTIPDEDGMPNLEHTPDFWINTQKMIDELRALRELREVCGMYCERLPVEIREALHAIPEIEKTHKHLKTEADLISRDQLPWFKENMR
jgi:hypothetical protein